MTTVGVAVAAWRGAASASRQARAARPARVAAHASHAVTTIRRLILTLIGLSSFVVAAWLWTLWAGLVVLGASALLLEYLLDDGPTNP